MEEELRKAEDLRIEEELRKAIELSKRFRNEEEDRRTKFPTIKAIDRYIRLERKLEFCESRREENRILFQLSKLEAINGVTTDDVIRRKQEIWKQEKREV